MQQSPSNQTSTDKVKASDVPHHPNAALGHQVENQPSFKRWLRQAMFIPILHSRWVDARVRRRLSEKVTQAEIGHRGEVFLIIENHLPIQVAYHIGTRQRAIDLFSQYRVWDTEENTGVLVYVNVCEHALEIVADRGINAQVSNTLWQAMCDNALSQMAKGDVEQGLGGLITEIGEVLRQHYTLENDPEGNELSDTVVFLK